MLKSLAHGNPNGNTFRKPEATKTPCPFLPSQKIAQAPKTTSVRRQPIWSRQNNHEHHLEHHPKKFLQEKRLNPNQYNQMAENNTPHEKPHSSHNPKNQSFLKKRTPPTHNPNNQPCMTSSEDLKPSRKRAPPRLPPVSGAAHGSRQYEPKPKSLNVNLDAPTQEGKTN